MHCQKQLGWCIFNNVFCDWKCFPFLWLLLVFREAANKHLTPCTLELGGMLHVTKIPLDCLFLLTSPNLCLSMSRVCWFVFDNTWSFPGKSPAYIGDALLEDGTKLDVVAKRLLWGKFNNAGSYICNSNFLPMFTISLKVKYVWHLTTSSALRKWKNALCPCSQKIWLRAIIFN